MKLKIFIAVFVLMTVVFIAFSQIKNRAFASAEDFPREALIYVQIADLPAFIKLWNESELKRDYLESDNYNEFKNNHLGRKLTSRQQEFSDAIGFPIDFDVLSSLAGNQASIALYDVGKLEFVFIAPVSDEIFAATKFALNRDKFIEATLDDGTIVYRVKVEADRGRQKQELIFTNLKGRFVLATSEKLLSQTLANINGKTTKNRLTDEPSFSSLSEKVEPHAATVWLNQTALNDDYYFKRYWLMSEPGKLKNIRAGMFDFQMQEGKFIERRKFLLDEAVKLAPLETAETAQMLSLLPPNIPFYQLQSAAPQMIGDTVEKAIYARKNDAAKKNRRYSEYFSFDDYDDYSSGDYESLGEKYDEMIDDTEDEESIERSETEVDFSKMLQRTNPRAILTFTQPKILPAPLFVEFQRAAVFDLTAPESFDRDAFESAIARKFAARLLIAAPDVELNWETKLENNSSWRELKLPKLGWSASYALRGNELILTNDTDFLREILTVQNAPQVEKQTSPLTGLTVINLVERENNYDKIFAELEESKTVNNFFTGNIKSLLDSISKVGKIEIKENYSQTMFDEEIIFTLVNESN